MDELDVSKWRLSVSFATKKNFKFFNVVSVGSINVKDQGLLA